MSRKHRIIRWSLMLDGPSAGKSLQCPDDLLSMKPGTRFQAIDHHSWQRLELGVLELLQRPRLPSDNPVDAKVKLVQIIGPVVSRQHCQTPT